MSHPNNDPALVRSTSDPEQIKEAQSREGNWNIEREKEWLLVLNTYAGRAVFHRILERCGEGQDPFAAERNRTDYLVGRLSYAIELRRELSRLSLELTGKMDKEAKDRITFRVDPRRKKKQRFQASGEPAPAQLVETELTVEDDDGN